MGQAIDDKIAASRCVHVRDGGRVAGGGTKLLTHRVGMHVSYGDFKFRAKMIFFEAPQACNASFRAYLSDRFSLGNTTFILPRGLITINIKQIGFVISLGRQRYPEGFVDCDWICSDGRFLLDDESFFLSVYINLTQVP